MRECGRKNAGVPTVVPTGVFTKLCFLGGGRTVHRSRRRYRALLEDFTHPFDIIHLRVSAESETNRL